MDQLQSKLKRYTTAIEALRGKGIGKDEQRSITDSIIFFDLLGSDKIKEELYDAVYACRYLPLSDRKNKPFFQLLFQLYGENQALELANICSKDALEMKQERDQGNEIRARDERIEEMKRFINELQAEIDRLKAALAEQAAKNTKTPWKPVPASVTITPREPSRQQRQTLKPTSVQFGGKSGPA